MKFSATPTCSTAAKNQWGILSRFLPEKVRIFGWKAVNNLFPTAENLWKQKIVQEPTCQLCRKGLENVSHALMTYKVVKNVWKTTPFVAEIGEVVEQDMLSLLHSISKFRSNANVELLVAIFLSISS